jgi:hypothetical protein
MKSWTEAQARTGNIAEAETANIEYDTLKVRTAALRRNNLPAKCVGRSHMTPNALHTTSVYQDFMLGSAFRTSGGGIGEFDCLQYGDYGGGWRTGETWILTGLLPGLLSVQVSLWAWMYLYNTVSNPKFVKFRVMSSDGQLVWATGGNYIEYSNISIVGLIEVAGPVTLTLEWKYSSPKNTGSGTDDNMAESNMMYGGGTALFVNTHR